jgi:hypothetical protein
MEVPRECPSTNDAKSQGDLVPRGLDFDFAFAGNLSDGANACNVNPGQPCADTAESRGWCHPTQQGRSHGGDASKRAGCSTKVECECEELRRFACLFSYSVRYTSWQALCRVSSIWNSGDFEIKALSNEKTAGKDLCD